MSGSTVAFWRRLDVPGHDTARLRPTANGHDLAGQSVFLDSRGPAALSYRLDLAPDWSTRAGRISGFIGDAAVESRIVRTPSGWLLDGQNLGMADVADLDLGFTPATNMAQLKRAGLSVGGAASFDVVWLEAGADVLMRLPQHYRRVSDSDYEYSSPTLAYRGTIVLAPSGFAADYPGLWVLQT